MKALYQVVGVVGLFLLLSSFCEAQQPSSEFELAEKVEQMRVAGRTLQVENHDLKLENALHQQENQALKAENAHLQKSQREAISVANTSQMNQQALLKEVTALRNEVAEFRKMLSTLLLQRDQKSPTKPAVAPRTRDPRDPFAQEPKPPTATPRTKPSTTAKDPFGAPSSKSPR
jgi:hypothetical protein